MKKESSLRNAAIGALGMGGAAGLGTAALTMDDQLNPDSKKALLAWLIGAEVGETVESFIPNEEPEKLLGVPRQDGSGPHGRGAGPGGGRGDGSGALRKKAELELHIDGQLQKRAIAGCTGLTRKDKRGKLAEKYKKNIRKRIPKQAAEKSRDPENLVSRIDTAIAVMQKEASYGSQAKKVGSGALELGRKVFNLGGKGIGKVTDWKSPLGFTTSVAAPAAYGGHKARQYWKGEKKKGKTPSKFAAIAKAIGYGTTLSPLYWKKVLTSPMMRTDPGTSMLLAASSSAGAINADSLVDLYSGAKGTQERIDEFTSKAGGDIEGLMNQAQETLSKVAPSSAFEEKKLSTAIFTEMQQQYPDKDPELLQQMAEGMARKARTQYDSSKVTAGATSEYSTRIKKFVNKNFEGAIDAWDASGTLANAQAGMPGENLSPLIDKAMKTKGVANTARQAAEGATSPIREFWSKNKKYAPAVAGILAAGGVGAIVLHKYLDKKRKEKERKLQAQALANAIQGRA